MEKEFFTDAIELITKECKDLVKENKMYEEYLNELSEERVNDIIAIYSAIQYDELELKNINFIYKDTKENKIQYLKNNINKILNLDLEVFSEDLIKYLNMFLDENGYIECSIKNIRIPLNYLIIFKRLGLIFINCEENIIKIHMPKKIVETFKFIIGKVNLKESIQDKNTITCFIKGLLNAYGMISIMEAYILITKLYKKLPPEMFNRYIFFMSNIIHMNFKADDIYMYNINLLDEEIPELEELHSRSEYHFYNIDELKMLARNEYFVNYMQYKILQEFVENNLGISIKVIKQELLDWYIILAQMDEIDAEDYMQEKIKEFNISNKNKQLLKQHIREVYEICPKWKLKGGIKYKKNNNVKILHFPNN